MMVMNLMTAMTNSISDVMETMFYLSVEPRETVAFSTVTDNASDPVTGCRLRFSGPFSGVMMVAVPMSLMEIMTANFMGEDRDRLSLEHCTGTVKEALNMVAGNALSKIDNDASFDLGLPEIIDFPGAISPDAFLTIETEHGFFAATVLID